MVLSNHAQSVMGGEENEQMCVGQDGVCFMLIKSMSERKRMFFGHIVRTKTWNKSATGEDGRQATKGQTRKDLVPGFKRLDKAGHSGWVLIGSVIQVCVCVRACLRACVRRVCDVGAN